MENAAASRLILAPYSEETVRTAAQEALNEIGGMVTIGFVFASADYEPHLDDFLELLQLYGHIPTLVGCCGSGLIGPHEEAEQGVGFSLLLLYLPKTTIHLSEIHPYDVENCPTPADWHQLTGVNRNGVDAWIALVNPFGFPLETWLARWNHAYPGIPTTGGLSSNRYEGQAGQDVFVLHNRTRLDEGCGLLIGFKGGVEVQPIVAQGCRPIGEPLTITRTDGNLLLAIGGKSAYNALAEAFDTLSEEEKTLAQGNLFVGLASSEYVHNFKRGDFLIRTILGADSSSGSVALGAYPRVGQTLQWQLRDKESAEADLRLQLRKLRGSTPLASLIFSCHGRGHDLFGHANHDIEEIMNTIGPIPTSGFFCNGEIGPVGKQSFVHGYTISAAFFTT